MVQKAHSAINARKTHFHRRDYWIEDEAGERAFNFDGKALRLRESLTLRNLQGKKLYKIQEKLLRIRDIMVIQNAEVETVATIKKLLLAF